MRPARPRWKSGLQRGPGGAWPPRIPPTVAEGGNPPSPSLAPCVRWDAEFPAPAFPAVRGRPALPVARPPPRVWMSDEPGGRGADAGRARPQVASRNEYDKTIQETEAAYLKILESSQTLLTVLKRESVNISKKRQASS